MMAFFRWYCHPKLVDHIEGDLIEVYRERLETKGKAAADARFVVDVLLLFRRGIIRPVEGHKNLNHYGMYKSYFTLGWRNLVRNKGFGAINIVGLGIGVAACMLIGLFIHHEMSYDQHVPDSENIYRITQYFNVDGEDRWGLSHPAAMAPTVETDFAEVVKAGRIMDNPSRYGAGANKVQVEDSPQQFHETGFAYVDQAMIDLLQIPFLHGNATSALDQPFTMVISNSKALKYFRNENPVGKTIYLNGRKEQPYTITGVMQDFPGNSNFSYEFLMTLNEAPFYDQGEQARWSQRNFLNFIKVQPGTDIRALETKLTEIMLGKYIVPFYRSTGRTKNADLLATQSRFELQPLRDMHLYSSHFDNAKTTGDIRFVWIFGAVASFILIIASINFVNLSTAQSARRSKEVGLRKVVGSTKKSLVFQFLTESFTITLFAFILGLVIVIVVIPYFAQLAERKMSIPWAANWFLPSVFIGILLVSLLAGLYPSFYLSRFNPAQVLKGRLSVGVRSPGLRSSLVVFQFAISIILIACALTVQHQMKFIMTRDLGFDKDQVIQISDVDATGNVVAFKEELKSLPGVIHVSNSAYLPIAGGFRNSSNVESLPDGLQTNFQAEFWQVDADYIETMGMTLLQGRNFPPQRDTTKARTAIINQAMATALGYKDPIGHKVSERQPLEIIGIVKDFSFQTADQEITPLALVFNEYSKVTSVKVQTEDMAGMLATLETKWKQFSPGLAFNYSFMNDSYARMYENVRRVGVILTGFTALAIVIACLGLFGLSAYMIEQRKKELGVRKVLGASMLSIFQLLVRHYLILVAISFVIAVPVSVYFMNSWLQSYVYRIAISWQVFALTAVGVLVVTVSTISYQAITAASANPVTSLKVE